MNSSASANIFFIIFEGIAEGEKYFLVNILKQKIRTKSHAAGIEPANFINIRARWTDPANLINQIKILVIILPKNGEPENYSV